MDLGEGTKRPSPKRTLGGLQGFSGFTQLGGREVRRHPRSRVTWIEGAGPPFSV